MGKKLYIDCDKLLTIKESIANGDSICYADSCHAVNEAAPEVDEYEIGAESNDPPMGGNYYHECSENYDLEVDSSDIDLSSFKKRDELVPSIWEDGVLNSRIRLKLLDIADDFWKFVNLTWVEPRGIILTGSICNYNWSSFSDIDLHLIVDFDEIDEKTEFVRDYLDAKKNEWNNEHKNLKIFGHQVELYVQNLDEMLESDGIYDLEENSWIRKPNLDKIKPIGLNKFSIKDKAAKIMTIIDGMYDAFLSTDDSYEIRQIGDDASYLWKKVKNMRKTSLDKDGESGNGNIVYKIMRRYGYLDKLWKLSNLVYDKSNSITESINDGFDMFGAAKNMFGVTNDIRECGFILPDGTMLDFSGRHMTNDKASCNGLRRVDHRSIEHIGGDSINISLSRFIESGAIRCDCRGAFINLMKKPTREQCVILSILIRMNDGCVTVEIGDDEVSLDYAEYDEAKPSVVIGQINRFFDEHIKLMGNVNESKFINEDASEKPSEEEYYWAKNNIYSADNTEDYDYYQDIIDRYESDDRLYDKLFSLSVDQHLKGLDRNSEYILTNGKLIKLHNHNSVEDIGLNKVELLKMGNIRIIGGTYSNYVYVELAKCPNNIQEQKLLYYIKTCHGDVYVDITYDNQLKKSFCFDRKTFSPELILRNIKNYFNANESIEKYKNTIMLLKEEWVGDSNSEKNPYKERWDAERKALKDFVCMYGKLMQSKEDDKGGKLYKCYWDKTISNLIGFNYCLCVQWDDVEMKPKSIVYIRACDKFSPNIKKVNYDYRGKDNQIGTYDDLNYGRY